MSLSAGVRSQALESLRKSIARDMVVLSEFRTPAPHQNRSSDLASAMALMGVSGMHAQTVRHAHAREIDHQKVLAHLKGDPRHVPIPLLEKVARSLVVVLIERAARPAPNDEAWTTVSQLRDVALLIAKLEALSDLAYDLGIGDTRHSPYGETTVQHMERQFEEECRGYVRRTGTLKRVYERLDEHVCGVHRLFWTLADKQRAWDLDAYHDYRGDFTGLIEAAMDAALTLEANFEERVFGPRQEIDHVA